MSAAPAVRRARQCGQVARALLAFATAALLAGLAAWLNWRPPVDPVPRNALPLAASGRAVAVEDGDTFVFEAADPVPGAPPRVRVRLHAIDAPELLQAGGPAARTALVELTRGVSVRVDCYKRDAHGRAICRAWVAAPNGRDLDIQLSLLREGRAWHYRAYASEQTADERRSYQAAEGDARAAGLGLWQRPEPMPPWSCRERLRAAQACD